MFGEYFWSVVCGFYISISKISGDAVDFDLLCQAHAAPILPILRTYLDRTGEPINEDMVCKGLTFAWQRFDWRSWKVDELFSIHSLDDLRKLCENKDASEDLLRLWFRTIRLIRASQENGLVKPIEELNLFHVFIRKGLPKVCIWLALRLLPTSYLSHRDSHGRLPLHLAVMFYELELLSGIQLEGRWLSRRECSPIVFPECSRAALDKSTVIEMLLEAYPQGAYEPDLEGNLPLPLLLQQEPGESQHLLHEIGGQIFAHQYFHIKDSMVKDHMLRSIEAFVKHAPEALALPSKTKVYPEYITTLPFMVAASSNCWLDVTFSILRENPSVVACGIKASDREIWLTDKLNKAQTHIQKLEDEVEQLRALLAQKQEHGTEIAPPSHVGSIQIFRNLPLLQFPSPKRRKVEDAEDPSKTDRCQTPKDGAGAERIGSYETNATNSADSSHDSGDEVVQSIQEENAWKGNNAAANAC
ncbi:expressed unknown protein [Seminavis robusta]|uniref:Uncharacterized protein n=1 Tax=Seminavis robusta TaxID=568900 RepID=A0A9N8D9V4_9STRA|nr:expressed unknown protein [Seminavis robusta]|eukprot:Sro49_g028860.1 n/a (472) ;mRNA; f:137543-138958